MKIYAKTHTGLVRDTNQDFFGHGVCQLGTYAIIADGMGGHNHGEYASKMAVTLLEEKLKTSEIIQLKTDIEEINKEMYNFGAENTEYFGMGTTLTAVIFNDNMLNLGHVGDSRAYLLRDGELCQLTTDHSYVQELLKQGQITEEEANKHPRKNILTQALGTSTDVEIQTISQPIELNDIILLCTDGLSNLVDNDEISLILQDNSVEKAGEKLTQLALERGGNDNITLIIIQLGEGGE